MDELLANMWTMIIDYDCDWLVEAHWPHRVEKLASFGGSGRRSFSSLELGYSFYELNLTVNTSNIPRQFEFFFSSRLHPYKLKKLQSIIPEVVRIFTRLFHKMKCKIYFFVEK